MNATTISTLEALRVELWRMLVALAIVTAALLVLVLLLRVLPYSPALATISLLAVLIGTLAVAAFFALRWNRALLGWATSWAVVPGYVYLVNLLVPREPDALDSLAYVFGTAYGVIAGAVGAIGGIAIARFKRQ